MRTNERMISETTKKVLQEYLGVSDYIMEISEKIFNMIISQSQSKLWNPTDNFVNSDGSEAYMKWMYLDVENTEVSNVVEEVYIKLYGFDARKYTFEEYTNFLGDKGLVNLAYAPSSKMIKLIMAFPMNGQLDSYGKNYIISGLNHEVKHALQSVKRGGTKISDAYTKSLRGTNFDTDETESFKLMRHYIKDCYYVFDSNEIDARLQQLYIELCQNDGELALSKSYNRVITAVKNYKWLLRILNPKDSFDKNYYEKERSMFQQILNDELGEGITIRMFIRNCGKGIKRFNEHFKKVIARYREENGISNGSFKQYANGEIPQGEIFNGRRNSSLWKKILDRFKKR